MIEHFFTCPHCGSQISMLLDPSVPEQNYIEDCENCCHPIGINLRFEQEELVEFSAQKIEQ